MASRSLSGLRGALIHTTWIRRGENATPGVAECRKHKEAPSSVVAFEPSIKARTDGTHVE